MISDPKSLFSCDVESALSHSPPKPGERTRYRRNYVQVSCDLVAVLLSTQAAYAAEPKSVKVGVLTDMSGPYAAITGKGAVEAGNLALEDFAKEAPDFKVELVTADHQNKPDIATGIARKWFEVENVSMISELTTSAVALAVQKLAEDKDKIVMVSGAGSSDLTGKSCSKTGFHWTYDTYALANGTGVAIMEQAAKRWFFLTVDYAFGQALEKDVSVAVKAKGGEISAAFVIRSIHLISRHSCCRRRPQRRTSSVLPTRAQTLSRASSRPTNSVSARTSGSRRYWSTSPTCIRSG